MNRHSKFCVLVFFTIVVFFSITVVVQAQPNSVRNQAIFDAERDAQEVFNERLWYLSGCFFTFGGYFLSQVYYAPVPAVALLGQSPEYVAFYTDTYRAKSRQLRSEAAFSGCLQGTVVQFCLPPVLGILLFR